MPKTFWLTGLPLSGRTTIAHALQARLRMLDLPVCLLDEDDMRQHLSRDLGISKCDRAENMRRAAGVARLLNDQGQWAIVAVESPLAHYRDWVRNIVRPDHFLDIFVDAPREVRWARDTLGRHQHATDDYSHSLVGVTEPFEPPVAPNLVIDTSRQALSCTVNALLTLVGLPSGGSTREFYCDPG